MKTLVKAIGKSSNSSLSLTAEIYDDNYLKDTLLGSCEIDLKVLLKRPANWWKMDFDLEIPEKKVKKKKTKKGAIEKEAVVDERGMVKTGGRITLKMVFLAAYEGILRVTLVEARNLVNPDMVGMPDIYVYTQIKKEKAWRTKTMKESSLDPDFKNEMHLFKVTEDTIFDGLRIKIMDDDIGRDDVVGSVCIDLFEYAGVSTDGVEIPRERLYRLKKGGELVAVVEFLPTCNLQVTCYEGKELRNPNLIGKTFDPYLYFESESNCNNNKVVLKR